MVKKNGSVAAAVLFDRKPAGFPLRSLAQLVTLRIAGRKSNPAAVEFKII
jgi:hypothetical protein